MKLIKCPRCGEYQMFIKQGEDSFQKDAECALCKFIIKLKDLKHYGKS